jgi:signal transduction histidine kinase
MTKTVPLLGRIPPKVLAYLLSVVAFLLALVVRDALTPIVGASLPYATFMVAAAFSAWFLGFGPGLVTMLLGLPAADFFFTPPQHSWTAFTRGELPATLTYFLACGFLLAMAVANRRHNLELRAKNLQIAQQAAAAELSNQQLRELSARLLRTQDDERRRIARELHDSVGQYLTAIGMNIEGAFRTGTELPDNVREKLKEAADSVRACSAEVRTISHLLHPPLLEELGLPSATRWCVQGFAERSGIQIQVEIPEDLPRLDRDTELVLFRVLQESLTNVHRHSGSKTALVRMGHDPAKVWLEVRDEGRRAALAEHAIRPGVGIRGMQERVRELAGVLDFTSDPGGTCVKAVIPLSAAPRKANSEAAQQFRQRAHHAG